MKNVEDLYPLSPLQQGILFHTMNHPQQGMYFEQFSFLLRGELEIDAFHRAWQIALERHSILRTAFLWEGLDEPLQVVRKQVGLPWNQEDWRSLSQLEQEKRIQMYLQSDRERGFDLAKAPLLRLALFQLDNQTYQFTWSHHHLLLDGWSVALLAHEVFEIYAALEQGQLPRLGVARPYRDFIAWLQKQDLKLAEMYWRRALAGYSGSLPIIIDKGKNDRGEREVGQHIQRLELSSALTLSLQTLIRQHQLTMNTLLRAVWAIILAHYSGESDVVFGSVSSGRPESLSGSERMIGMFVNTLPVHIQVKLDQPLVAWLKHIQAEQSEASAFEHTPLVQVKGWSDVSREHPLFETLFIFENYRLGREQNIASGRLQIQPMHSFEQTNYPLILLALPKECIELQIRYDPERFESADIARMLSRLQALLEEIAFQKPACLADLALVREGELRISSDHHAWMQDELLDLREIEQAIMSIDHVDNCAVRLRRTEKTVTQLVAYSVSSNFSIQQIHSRLQNLLPDSHLPQAYVPVTRLPLTIDGDLDEPALRRIPIVDSDTIARWENHLKSIQGIGQVAVLAQEHVDHLPPIHISDLLPNWKIVTASESIETSSHRLSSDKTKSKSQTLAISHGVPLLSDVPTNLGDFLRKAAQDAPEQGMLFIQRNGQDVFLSYSGLLANAERILAGLRRLGLKPMDKVLLQLDLGQDFVSAFWGCVLGGIIPVPLTIAPTYEQHNSALAKLASAWHMLGHPIVLAGNALTPAIRALNNLLQVNFQVENIAELLLNPPDLAHYASQPDDLAILLLTSGSTGAPKAVMQKHCSIIHFAASYIQGYGATCDDVSINWMPLDHVGGIIMFHVRDTYLACRQIHAPTDLILQQPLLWLDWIHAHRATTTWAPNFAFGLVNAQAEEITRRSWDLSSIKIVLNGGEAINPKTARNFLNLLGPHGLPGTAMHPIWGMSETSSAVTFSNEFTLASTSNEDAFVEVGEPLPGFSMRIVDADNQLLPEETIGRLQVKGPTVTDGYFNLPEQNQTAFTPDGWFITGDLAFLRNGRLTITGREKDVIIINGINYYSHEIEAAAEEIRGVEASFTAACAVRLPASDTDSLVIFFNQSKEDDFDCIQLIEEIRNRIVENVGINPAFLIPVEKDDIPKTQIGKIQRSLLRKKFENGDFNEILKRLDILTANANTLPDWFFRKIWRKKRLRSAQAMAKGRIFLVFADSLGLAKSLCSLLAEQGQRTVIVEKGDDFQKVDPEHYHLDPANQTHYWQLFDSLISHGLKVDQIIHLGMYSRYLEECSSVQTLETAQNDGLYSLLFLIQAFHQHISSEQSIRLIAVASNAQTILATDLIAYEKTPVLGFLKSATQEIPWLVCCHLDLAAESIEEDARQLFDEIASSAKDAEVGYRSGVRYVRRLEKTDLSQGKKPQLPFKLGGMYLISGGLGGLGVEIARYLLQQFQARVFMVGRTILPERNCWDEVLLEGGPLADRIRSYRSLEGLGGEIFYASADVARPEEISRAVEQAKTYWGCELDGVLHLAGSFQQELLVESTPESFSALLRPKLVGTWVLHQLIKNHPDRLFIAFSSANGFLGGTFVSAYAAANSFVEAFCDHQNANSNSLNYCFAWSMWDELGMSRNYPLKELTLAHGFHAISTKQGITSFVAGLYHEPGGWLVGLNASNPYVYNHLESTPLTTQTLQGYFTSVSSMQEALSRVQESIITDRFGSRVACSLVPIDNMPLTPEGDIDRQALAWMKGQRANSLSSFSVATTPLEKILVGVWAEVFGGIQVGIHDSFLELGGDSILSIQIVAKAKQKGIHLTPGQLFQARTVAELAKIASTSSNLMSQELVVGDIPFTPIQRWFIENELPDMHHFNMSVLLEARQHLDGEKLEKAVQRLLFHHDALRIRLRSTDHGYQLTNADKDGPTPFAKIDLSARAAEDQSREIEVVANEAQASLNLQNGPVVRFVLFDLGPSGNNRLLIVVHHLAIDGVSWRILLEDLQNVYQQMVNGLNVNLPRKTSSFREWAQRLEEFSRSAELRKELDLWLGLANDVSLSPLPVDFPGGRNTKDVLDFVSMSLDKAETMALLQDVPSVFHTQIHDVMLTALAYSFYHWTGKQALLIDLESHGREDLFEDLDITRTIGWFTSLYPMVVDVDTSANLADSLKRTKERLQTIPHHGIGYGLLRYLSQDEDVLRRLRAYYPDREVRFNYLGQFDQVLSEVFRVAPEFRGHEHSLKAERSYLIEIEGLVSAGQLQMTWVYSPYLHNRSTIDKLAVQFMKTLRLLISSAKSSEAQPIHTPSDFAGFGWSAEDLGDIVDEIGRVLREADENINENT
jgi:non-ribosomal peptide synthase protein (TIGR01720 family)